MYPSTLRSYVEAIGGKLELVVKLPSAQRFDYIGSAMHCRLSILLPLAKRGDGNGPLETSLASHNTCRSAGACPTWTSRRG
jgi:hypothetical protein